MNIHIYSHWPVWFQVIVTDGYAFLWNLNFEVPTATLRQFSYPNSWRWIHTSQIHDRWSFPPTFSSLNHWQRLRIGHQVIASATHVLALSDNHSHSALNFHCWTCCACIPTIIYAQKYRSLTLSANCTAFPKELVWIDQVSIFFSYFFFSCEAKMSTSSNYLPPLSLPLL